ncbi:MAG TPA: hypothetical protein DD400_06180 [Rhodospirillaceae bacterium]|nr:hypothetical protein [Rhodospirillaceae bacterium]
MSNPPSSPDFPDSQPETSATEKMKENLLEKVDLFKDKYSDEVADKFKNRQRRLVKLIELQGYVIGGILLTLILLLPILQPIYSYVAMRPDGAKKSLAAMTMPNLTDQTVISWSATAITDILTFGFGDLDQRVLAQRNRFTESGWISFVKGFVEKNVSEGFKGNQLVLTTVPSDLPVIVFKGTDVDNIYKWVVEMPFIMTYSTNNMASSRSRGIVRLVLVRVSTDQNVAGIGIDSWKMN